MPAIEEIEATVRLRLRSLRQSLGWSLDDLAERTHMSASTISRVETGKRALGLETLLPLCEALHTDIGALLETTVDDDDVVIRPAPTTAAGITAWPLTRHGGGSSIAAVKMRIEPSATHSEPQVHPGHDTFFVLSGSILLTLGDRELVVSEGEVAEFSTMTPHCFVANGGPAEVIAIFDRDGHQAHMVDFD